MRKTLVTFLNKQFYSWYQPVINLSPFKPHQICVKSFTCTAQIPHSFLKWLILQYKITHDLSVKLFGNWCHSWTALVPNTVPFSSAVQEWYQLPKSFTLVSWVILYCKIRNLNNNLILKWPERMFIYGDRTQK